MSNLENQLDLFQGVLLTNKQEQQIATWVEGMTKRAVALQDEVTQ